METIQNELSENPLERYGQPPFSEETQDMPGTEGQLQVKADHGEQSYRGSGKLTGKKAIITGGDSGIGRAVAIAIAREGADVAISYLNEDDDALETTRLIEEAGCKSIMISGDNSDEEHCREIISRTLEEFGQIDILVNNSAFQMSRDSLQDISAPLLIPYSATKAAIQNFTASLAQLWAEKGIRGNCVAPGPIWTPLIPATLPLEKVNSFG